ncbi:MAG: hypothetical protein ISR64_04730 [Deltaproteobacteria bacterium]|nr:hypothetical protein [Deltaproteobacteria bacterium]
MEPPNPCLMAGATLAFPFVAGLCAGWAIRVLRRGRFTSGFSAAAIGLAPVVIPFILPPFFMGIGLWDGLTLSCLAGLGAFVTAHELAARPSPGNLALGAVVTLAGLALLEGGSRLFLSSPPAFPPAREARFVIPEEGAFPLDKGTWRMLYPALHPEDFAQRTRVAAKATRHVLHVGDSMVEGLGLAPSASFPAVMTRLDKGVAHLNAGVSGTGPDFYYALARSWMKVLDVDLVVLHLFVGNDFDEMDFPYAYCDDGPLLDYGDQGPVWNCPEPRWGATRNWPRLVSPAPYFLRVSTEFSVLARHLCSLFWHMTTSYGRDSQDEEAFAHFRSIMEALDRETRQAGARLTVVFLPDHWAILNEDGGRYEDTPVRKRMFETCESLGIPTLDAADLFRRAIAEKGSREWFISQISIDPHLNPRGHELLAEWLLKRLESTAEVSP